jgi:peptidylprolyl isomerase
MTTMIIGFVSCGSGEPTSLIGESADKVNKVGPAFSDITIEKQDNTTKPTDKTDPGKTNKPVNPDESLAKTVVFETNLGSYEISLFPETPIASKNMIDKVSSGFYNGLIFHRIMKGFMVQGGDPTGTGGGGGDMSLDERQVSTMNKKGTISMASSQAGVNQSDCQFFINTFDNTGSLDPQGFVAFGQVTKGYDVVEKIENTPVGPSMSGENSKPLQEVRIIKAYVK